MKRIFTILMMVVVVGCVKGQAPTAEWLKGVKNNQAKAMTTDADGSVYVTGNFSGTVDFDPSANGIFTLSSGSNGWGVFVLKLDGTGNFVWARSMQGGSSTTSGYGIAVDASKNVYVTGGFWGVVDFDPGTDSTKLISQSSEDAFILKLSSEGNFAWVKQIKGSNEQIGYSIATDTFGNVYTAGTFYGITDLDPSSGYFNPPGNFGGLFVLKLDTIGNFIWVDAFRGVFLLPAIAVDGYSNVYTTGTFGSSVDFDPSTPLADTFYLAPKLNSNNTYYTYDIFVLKLDSSGYLDWVKDIGGSGDDEGRSIDVDKFGNVYTTGLFGDKVNFNTSGGSDTLTAPNPGAGYVLKLNNLGDYVWAKQIDKSGASVVLNKTTDVYVNGNRGITKLEAFGGVLWQKDIEALQGSGKTIGIDASDNVFAVGECGVGLVIDTCVLYPIAGGAPYNFFVLKLKGNATTGIEDADASMNFTLYPNPAQTQLTINTNGIAVEQINIYNATGSLVMAAATMVNGQLSIVNLANGIYFLEVKTAEEVGRRKFVKM